ncbi:hypothetical protein C2E25_08570 [Geothermobacter hydrogeniphilus]|uniref:Uncharacterized protein n=1 Tax=Geothermobacter hydrogeniphilus TaxID=1969733 RepID=A0A2K2HAH4_9BACT|nr:hypothetical protein [Geothermobacter hydrogeniphilus]PNU20229.1 hypothetical protein C2E25_08570 [Geothermobacter hydrogeniphilus]
MSEYQYLEFLAVDHPLTAREMAHLRGISTRAQITPVSFINEYSWGGLKADPRDFMRQFFDAHVFIANWGDAIFMVRLPKEAIDQKTLKAFCTSPHLEFEKLPEHWLLTWSLGETEDYDRFGYVDEGPGLMPLLAPVREELMRGDLRSLYLGWLRAVTTEETDPDDLEPLAFHGLNNLTAAQQALAEFLEVDIDLLAGVGSGSKENQPDPADDAALDAWLDHLPKAEVNGYLRQMLGGQGASAERALRRRYAAWQAQSGPTQNVRRSVAELWRLAEEAKGLRLVEEAKVRQQAEIERKRQRDAWLAKLAADFPRAWKSAHEDAGKGHAHAYDAACRQLVDLRDAYSQHAALAAFQKEFQEFMAEHSRRRALVQRLVKAGLWRDK